MKSLSHVWLFMTPWTAAYQAPPSMGFSRQEYCSGVPLPSPLEWLRNVNFTPIKKKSFQWKWLFREELNELKEVDRRKGRVPNRDSGQVCGTRSCRQPCVEGGGLQQEKGEGPQSFVSWTLAASGDASERRGWLVCTGVELGHEAQKCNRNDSANMGKEDGDCWLTCKWYLVAQSYLTLCDPMDSRIKLASPVAPALARRFYTTGPNPPAMQETKKT